MERSRLEQVERIYEAAIDQPPERRSALLDSACRNDDELRREVESLLRFEDKGANFMDTPPADLAAELFDDENETRNFVNEKIGHYKVERFLGQGGMGEVYLAADDRLQRRVALKVLRQSVVGDAERLMRFEREAQSASALNHPNILTVHEFGESDGIHFIASEFVDGETLRQKLLAKSLELADALDFAVQVASALSTAHAAGITHRDIKPENIMVRRDGYIKVLDFGLAKLLQDEDAADAGPEDPTRALLRTEPGVVMGTDAYMSPEQARGIGVDARTDIWSLGIVIYEMLAGQRPFLGETRADVIVAVLSAEPVPVAQLRPDMPPELGWIVSKALSKDIEGRYQTSKEIRADLIKIRKQLELQETVRKSGGGPTAASEIKRDGKVHSTLETGLKTSEDADNGTNDGENIQTSRSGLSSGIDIIARQAKAHKFWSVVISALIVGLVSIGVYFAIPASNAAAPIDSLAVLPFENASGNADLNYVSDGLSESLIDRFAQLPQLKVISRNSSFQFRGPNLDLREIAAQLGVRAIVTGSVTKQGDDLSIRVDIIDAKENRQLTGSRYRRKAGDLIDLEHEIANTAAEQLRFKLTDSQAKRLSASGTDNSDAFRYYLSGLVELKGPQDIRSRALEYFEQAIKLDPEFAAAHTEIAWIYWARANGSANPQELRPLAKAATERALQIDPNLAKAHVLQAMMKEFEFDWNGADSEYRHAIELSPNLDFARNNYAFFLSVMGRQTEALAELEQQRVRDPINRRMNFLQEGIVLTQARKFDEALDAYSEAQAVDPTTEISHFLLAYAYSGKGMYNEAADHLRRSIAAFGGEEKYSQPLVYLAATYAKMPEKQADARAILARLEAANEYVSPALLAIVYASLGDNDKAIERLEHAYVKRDPLLRFIGTGYEYDGLRDDRRFADLIRRIGFSK
ncbi:MAG TPA: protein kinase [Pyrinomonadaceae bacterium]|nr:protein kinase [Pyrinomonadaceae bacterium]